ncbi:MAG TPA: hypothetical protein VG867_06070 [Rhizomicrobium sp.]|nr:hypothetical protein [Rhizomicrobium sp.]
MRNIFLATIGLSAAIAFGATAANAEGLSDCTHAKDKVTEALAKDTSGNHDAAVKESNYGRDFCNNGLYKQGVAHYAQALKLLGVS